MARVIKARNITYKKQVSEEPRPLPQVQYEQQARPLKPPVVHQSDPMSPPVIQPDYSEPEPMQPPHMEPEMSPQQQVMESEGVLQQALEDAEDIKKKAYIQGEKLGYEAGLTKGMEEGLKEGRQSIDEEQHRMLRSCKHLYESILRKRQQLVDEASQEMLELSYEIAEKILCIEIERNDSAIIEVFRQAVGALMSKHKISVKLNPVDAEKLMEAKDPLIEELGLDGLSIISDEKLERMSCVVKTPNETVDASMDTQLREIRAQQDYMNGETHE